MENLENIVDAFEEGISACNSGKDIGDNPYDETDSRHDEWDDGWSRQRYFNRQQQLKT